jgi:hypothetical protein
MTFSYVIDKVLTSSLLIFFFYSCFATLVLCIAYFIEEEVQGIMAEKREQQELESRLTGSAIDPVVDELYES